MQMHMLQRDFTVSALATIHCHFCYHEFKIINLYFLKLFCNET